MSRQTVPVRLSALPRENPMVWTGEEEPVGVFIGSSDSDDALALLGTPTLALPAVPKLPADFRIGAELERWFRELEGALAAVARGAGPALLTLAALDEDSRLAVDEVLGAGEVEGELCFDGVRWTVREAVLPGVWRVQGDDGSDRVEVGPMAVVVRDAAAALRPAPIAVPADPPDVMNGPAVLEEISDRAAACASAGAPGEGANHVINFTLLPLSGGDQDLLTGVLGRADLTLTSGGFGTCRIMATTVRHVWAVQYLNAMGNTILDTIEIGDVPAAATAGKEDFEDSAERLGEIVAAYRA